ncbi:hypothetical protein [Streptomyces pseudogriseolus]|uniref:hypothetical protein n=1 Tax=Streptomyces pseudogriseolus TaxID=36817 RepID=UPI00346BA49D
MRVLTRLKSVLCALAVVAGTLTVATGSGTSAAWADGTPTEPPAITGIEVVKRTATVQDFQELTVACPRALVPISGGGEAKVDVAFYDNVSLTQSEPTRDSWGPKSWTVSARTDDSAPFTLTVYAVCAPEPWGYEVVSQYYRNIANGGTLTVACPEGKTLLGGGGRVRGTDRRSMGKSYPATAAGNSVPNQWAVSGYDHGQSGLEADAHAVCVYPLSGVTTTRYTATTSDYITGGVHMCAPGKRVIGGGAAGAYTEDSLVASRPALAAETGKSDGWWVQAIGLRPERTVDLYVTCI